MTKKILIVFMALAFFAVSTSSFAATRAVPGAYATIQLAITAAAAGDVVNIAGGSYAEDLTVLAGQTNLTIKCSSVDSMVTITGAAGAGNVLSLAAGGTSATALTLLQNIAIDISANGAKLAANRLLTVATTVDFVKLYNCSFSGKAATTTALVEYVGAAANWQIENCTFNNAIGSSVALKFTGTAGTNVTAFNILGNTFNGTAAGAIATDARAIFVSDITAQFQNIYIGGNTFAKEGIVLNFDDTTALPAYSNVTVYDNVFTQSNAFLMQNTNADVLTLGLGAAAADCWSVGQLRIRGNKFGSLTTEGDTFFAIMFDAFKSADFNEANVFINYNNFQYPMTNGTDLVGPWGGHVTANKTGASDLTGIDATNNYWGQITGPLTAYESKGIAVIKTAGNPYSYIPYISTYSVPQIDETNHGITIFDYDGNGHIDRAVVWFDQFVDPSTIAYSGWAIAGGYTFNTNKPVKLSIDNDHEGTPDGTFALTLFLNEKSAYDTGLVPDITYTKSTGTLTGITGSASAKVLDVLTATATEHDKALPVIASAVTGDATNNGKLDKLTVTFSEPVTLSNPSTDPIADADWVNNITVAGIVTTAGSATANSVVYTLTEAGYNTGATPAVTFAKDGSDDVMDLASNLMLAAAVTAADGAAPVAVLVETADFSTSITNNKAIGDPDGYIDGYTVTFSENIPALAAADSAKIRTALSSAEVASNTIDMSTAEFTALGNTVLTIKGRSNKGGSWNTDARPKLTYANAGGVKDAAGNQWVYFWDLTLGPAAAATSMSSAGVADKAAPALVQATGQVSSKNLWITFSEPVKNTIGGTNPLVAGDFTYNNVSNVALNATAIASLAEDNGADGKVQITMDNNFTRADVENDSVKISAAANVVDLSPANNLAYVGVAPSPVYVTINDVVPPTLTAAITEDLDNDGWIDTIKLTFSEAINDANIAGYNGTDKISLNASTNWAVAGYNVVGLNFVSDGTEQNTATADAITRVLTGVYDDYAKYEGGSVFTKKVINVGDADNDTFLYLMVQEGSGADKTYGDTDAVPALTITGGATASKVGDFKPNYVTTLTTTPADKAGAALMAAKFTSANDMTVYLSEAVADSIIKNGAGAPVGDELTTSDFSLYVGNMGNLVSAVAKDVIQSAPGVVELFFQTAITTAENPGFLGLSGGGVLNDLAAFGSTQTVGMAQGIKDVTAWDGTGGTVTPGGPLAPPSNLVVVDVAPDNGHWLAVTFTPSTDTRVQSYQFYRGLNDPDDPQEVDWALFAWVPKPYMNDDGTCYVYVPTPFNGIFNWGIVASSGTVLSTVDTMPGGKIAVASLAPAGKLAEGVLLSPIVSTPAAVTGAIDNIAFSPLTAFAGNDNPGAGTGILVSWTAPIDHGIVGGYGLAGSYNFPIYGVDKYEVYRRAPGTNAWTLIGTTGPGSTSYVDATAPDGKLVYQYMVKEYDGNVAHTLSTATVYAMANMNANPADFSSDGKVDFTDFTMFASAYGKKTTDTGWIGLFDLAANGKVDFDDFTAFSADYGFGVAKAGKAAIELPSSNIGIGLTSSIDEANSMYYVNVNFSDAATINGFELTLSYNPAALELVKESITGLVGLNIPSVSDGNVSISSMFAGENFSGSFTIGFKNRGINNRINIEVTNALVADNQFDVSQIKDLTSATLKAMPTVYALSKNFPNPFNPTTTIEYALPSSGKVDLVVYNMTGQKVRTLVSETKTAGFFKVVWDGRNDTGETVASGLYFYKLVSGKFNKIEKMTLVK